MSKHKRGRRRREFATVDVAPFGGARRRKVQAAALVLCVAAACVAATAQWGRVRRAGTSSASLTTSSASLTALAPAPAQGGSFSPSSPSKEYIYAGGRLVATEEPAKVDQTITFAQPPNKTYGDAPFGLSATSSSGLPVAFTVTSGPASVSGSTVTISGAGTVSVRADQAGNAGFNPAQNVTRTFTVAKAQAALTLSNLSQVYNGSPKVAGVTTSPAGLSVVSLTYNGSATAPTGAGSYAVVASLNNPNYSAPNVNGTLAIAKATAALTLSNLSHTYNGSPRSATVTTTPAGLTGVSVTYSGSATAPTNTGSYAVVASLSNPNYTAPAASGTLVINKAPATLSLGNLTGQVYNGSPRSATVTTTPAGLTGVSITYDGSATPPTGAGSYAVAATLSHTNYTAPAVNGTLVIAKAPSPILWNNPADIGQGTALSDTQLNAAAGVPGTFTYTPPAGTVLGVGNGQQLYVSFAPDDAANYNPASAGVLINVIGCPTPAASSFAASSPIGAGAGSYLSWNVPYATGVTIAGVPGAFGAAGGTSVWPAETTTYTLTATAAGVCSPPAINMQATVVVVPCPTEGETIFTADSYLVAPGAGVQLSWSAPHATSINVHATTACAPTQICMTPVYSGNAASGSVGVSPTMTTTYVITAENNVTGCAQIQEQLTVETSNAMCSPGAYFSPGQLPPGDYLDATAMLEWSVPNATSLTITDNTGADYGTYGPSGQIYISSRFATRTYTLTAQIAVSAACSPFVLFTTVECSIDCSSPSEMY